MAFVGLEKPLDRLLRKLLWWTLCVVGVPEWLVKVWSFVEVMKVMYVGTKVELSWGTTRDQY